LNNLITTKFSNRNKELEDHADVIKLNEESNGKTKENIENIMKNLANLQEALDELRNKEKEDFDVVLKLNEDNKETQRVVLKNSGKIWMKGS